MKKEKKTVRLNTLAAILSNLNIDLIVQSLLMDQYHHAERNEWARQRYFYVVNSSVITEELQYFSDSFDRWVTIIQSSFGSGEMKEIYLSLIKKHRDMLEI